jgi:hypothetical protein
MKEVYVVSFMFVLCHNEVKVKPNIMDMFLLM